MGPRTSEPDGRLAVSARDLVMRFGGVTALDQLTFEVTEGETLGVVGPNGAGKSTLLSLLAGKRAPTSGQLVVVGHDMAARQGHRMARNGVGLAHQVPKPFTRLSVRENLEVAAQVVPRRERHLAVTEGLAHTGLADKADRVAGSLGLLDLKRLELARALALRPTLLLLDEVAAGLTGDDLDQLIQLLKEVRTFVPTVVLVEHVQDVIHELADRVVVLEWGKKIAEGTPAEVGRDERVITSYLGDSSTVITRVREPSVTERAPLLEVNDIHASYGEVRALNGASLEVQPGEIVAVLGANGAGKTTLARSLMGAVPVSKGSVLLDGEDVTHVAPHRRVAQGFSICPEGRRLFPDLTVETNLELGLVGSRNRSRLETAYELFPKLATLKDRRAGTLSGGEQQMVAIGRALASDPRVIIMDEVSLGLAPVIIDRLYEAMLTIQSWGTSILLIEQSIHRALAVSDRVLLLRQGSRVLFGPSDAVEESHLAEIYLGAGTTASETDVQVRPNQMKVTP